MKPIIMEFDYNSSESLYIQLYSRIREDITSGNMIKGERLPSLRLLAKNLSLSITTVQLAYNQLLVEGYIESRPQSGYYVTEIFAPKDRGAEQVPAMSFHMEEIFGDENPYICDGECFDFIKWKKCTSQVFNEHSELLLFESDSQGELALRHEIAKYVYSARGVTCSPDQIVIGAGTQQLTGHLCRILSKMSINHVSLESPGYLPVQSIFADNGFGILHIPVAGDGIDITRLPVNVPSAVYVSPSNQFPTGAVMPVGKRHRLLEWAKSNGSIIIEDDYDSELRYFGKPVPALRSLDSDNLVAYLGSFSSTLFPAVKISYMVLPQPMADIFGQIKDQYTQTCSKAEQLTLALFMEKGYYYTGIRKLRNLYAQKLSRTLQAFASQGTDRILPVDTKSGINLILKVKTKKTAQSLCREAKSLGLQVVPLSALTDQDTASLIFYYSKLPLASIHELVARLVALWLG